MTWRLPRWAARWRPPETAAARLVLAWVRCYSAVLPSAAREQRREDLAADLHDHLADLAERHTGGVRAGLEIGGRWLRGVPADVAWALSPTLWEGGMETGRLRGALAVLGWVCSLLVAAFGLWLAVAGLRHGWRELLEHWWSTLAVTGVVASAAGLVAVLLLGTRSGGPSTSAS